MKRLLLAIAIVALTSSSASAAIIVVDLGTAAPPGVLGGYKMVAFPNDPRANFTNVTSVPVPPPVGGLLGFNHAVNLREIGFGWATWSHGYTGDVYFDTGTSLVMSLPAGTGAFIFYAEPNNFAVFNITATANDGTMLTVPVNGFAGANGFGFYTTDGTLLSSITVTTTAAAAGFAVGEFSIAGVPEPATLALCGLIGVGLVGYRYRRRLLVA